MNPIAQAVDILAGRAPYRPECCKSCRWLDRDYNEFMGQTYYYCEKNIWLPVKKRTCKRWLQNPTLVVRDV